ncbi:MAG TPA: hypothetical protein PKD12_02795 [Nitrospira sp.]|nr:hypothetical protein [Nitrospira sp.]
MNQTSTWRAGWVSGLGLALCSGLFLGGCSNNTPETPSAQAAVPVSVIEVQRFHAADFTWPELLERLEKGQLAHILDQESDWVWLTVMYLHDLNELFADPDMNMFIDPLCFSRVYRPEMTTKLEAVMWSSVAPKAVGDLAEIMLNQTDSAATFRQKYPYVATVLGEIRDEVPSGTLDRLFYVKNLRQIFRDRARKDARTLMTVYKCQSGEVTERIYNNAYKLVSQYRQRG